MNALFLLLFLVVVALGSLTLIDLPVCIQLLGCTMSIATKLGLAYGAHHRDPYQSRRGLIINDPRRLVRPTSSGAKPSAWLTDMLSVYWQNDAKQKDETKSDPAMAMCSREVQVSPEDLGPSEAVEAVEVELAQPPPTRVSMTAPAQPTEEGVDPIVPQVEEPSTTVDAKPSPQGGVQAEDLHPSTQGSPTAPERHPLTVTAETGVWAHQTTVDAGTEMLPDGIEAEDRLKQYRHEAEGELRGVIPAGCLSEVVDCILNKIQTQNVMAVALDDINQQVTEHVSQPPKKEKSSTHPAPRAASPCASDDPSQRELAIYLYSLRKQVVELQSQMDAQEAALQRELRQQKKKGGSSSKRITVEVVKAYDDDPVPYKKPPFRLAHRPGGDSDAYEMAFDDESTHLTSSRTSRSAVSSHSSSGISTEISNKKSNSIASSIHSSSSSSIKWPGQKKIPAHQMSSSSSFSNSTISHRMPQTTRPRNAVNSLAVVSRSSSSTQSSRSSTSSSSVSIDEQAKQAFLNRLARQPAKRPTQSAFPLNYYFKETSLYSEREIMLHKLHRLHRILISCLFVCFPHPTPLSIPSSFPIYSVMSDENDLNSPQEPLEESSPSPQQESGGKRRSRAKKGKKNHNAKEEDLLSSTPPSEVPAPLDTPHLSSENISPAPHVQQQKQNDPDPSHEAEVPSPEAPIPEAELLNDTTMKPSKDSTQNTKLEEEFRAQPTSTLERQTTSSVGPGSPVLDHIDFSRYTDLFVDVGKCKTSGRDIKICYNIFGDKRNPCILCIQGLGTSLLGFSLDFIDILVNAGFCVIRYDNRDCGLSTSFDDVPGAALFRYVVPEWASVGERLSYTLFDMMEDGMGLLTALGIEKAHVFGLSMGGMIAQLMAIHHPDRILSLNILFSHMGGKDHIEPPVTNLVRFLRRPKSDAIADKIEVMVQFIEFLGQQQYQNDPQMLREYFDIVAARNGKIEVAQKHHVSAVLRAPSRKKALEKITCPTLIMHGMVDPLIPVKNGYMLAETIPTAKLVLFPRLGHMFPPQLHEELADQLLLNLRKASQ
eukprot:gene8263-5783_t